MKLKNSVLWIFFLTLLILFSTGVSTAIHAQENQKTSGIAGELMIQQAVDLAIEKNLELKSFQESLGISRGQLTGAKVFPTNPEFTVAYFNANPLERSGQSGRVSEYSLILSQEFEIGGQRGDRTQVAQSTIDKVESEVERIKWVLVGDVLGSFYQVLMQQERLDLSSRVILLTEDLVSLTENKFAAGYAPEFEVNFAKLELQTALREKARVLNQLQVAKYSLNNLMARPWETEFEAIGDLSYQPLTFDMERLKVYAVQNRSDLKALEFAQLSARSEINLARSINTPNLRFSLIYDKEFDKDRFGAMVSLPIRLFNRNQGDIASSIATQKTAETRYSFLKFLIEKEVASSYSEVLLASKEVQLLEEGMLVPVEQNLDLVQKAYQRGEVEIIEVITAQRNFVDIRTAYLVALYNFNFAIANLQKALGGNLADIGN
ncbi:MAG: TolC family protein [Candidatus Scalindua sp.]